MLIHPTAVIDPNATIDPSCAIGPYCVIEEGVTLGANCRLGPNVHILGNTTIGQGNQFHSGAVIGDAPQDSNYSGAPTKLVIGNDNRFREHTTVHRSNSIEESTVLGNDNFLMAGSHIGHNSVVGNSNVFANSAILGGHVLLGNGTFLSAHCAVHQFVRVGDFAMMQGGAGASQDVPPFTVSLGINKICGLNTVGLRRAGIEQPERTELKRLYVTLFRSGLQSEDAVRKARLEYRSERALQLIDFIASCTRGWCRHSRGH
jgi:UDP-N-acetylglucosamine acyltransferase